MPQFEILPGLPPYGPSAMPFPSAGNSLGREGLIVKFRPETRESWVGNFERAYNPIDNVVTHPDDYHVIVVAGGAGYIVDPEACEITHHMSKDITFIATLPDLGAIVVADSVQFGAFRADGVWWNSDRIAWDGIRNVRISGTDLFADAYSVLDERWHPFSLDLLTGKAKDAVYTSEMARAMPIRKQKLSDE